MSELVAGRARLHWLIAFMVSAIAYFVQPDDDTPLDPLVSEAALEDVDFDALIARKGLQAGTRSLTGGEYLRTRIAATYGPKKPLKT